MTAAGRSWLGGGSPGGGGDGPGPDAAVGAGRGLRDERAATGGLRRPAPLVAGVLPGHAAGLLPAGERGGPVRLLAGGAVGAGRDPVLPAVAAPGRGGDLPGPGHQPTPPGA